jgi:hypothetical protein
MLHRQVPILLFPAVEPMGPTPRGPVPPRDPAQVMAGGSRAGAVGVEESPHSLVPPGISFPQMIVRDFLVGARFHELSDPAFPVKTVLMPCKCCANAVLDDGIGSGVPWGREG